MPRYSKNTVRLRTKWPALRAPVEELLEDVALLRRENAELRRENAQLQRDKVGYWKNAHARALGRCEKRQGARKEAKAELRQLKSE